MYIVFFQVYSVKFESLFNSMEFLQNCLENKINEYKNMMLKRITVTDIIDEKKVSEQLEKE